LVCAAFLFFIEYAKGLKKLFNWISSIKKVPVMKAHISMSLKEVVISTAQLF
jgi:hypothetical protein